MKLTANSVGASATNLAFTSLGATTGASSVNFVTSGASGGVVTLTGQTATTATTLPGTANFLGHLYINGADFAAIDASANVIAPEPSPVGAGADPLDKEVEKGVRCTGNACEVDKSLIDKFLQNTTALATSARFVPSSKDGKPNGFKVYAIRPGSVFAKIGMQNADLVKAINGLDMATPDRAFEAYTKLKSASHLTMQLERRGENVTLDYQIR